MTLRVNSREELDELLDRDKADSIAPKHSQAKAAKKQARGNVVKDANGTHVIILRVLVAVCAYFLLALGWIIGAVGDAIYEVGQRMHDAKWRIS